MNKKNEQLIHDALHGELTDADRDHLSDWVAQSPENAKAYYRAMLDEAAIARLLYQDTLATSEGTVQHAGGTDTAIILAELSRLESSVQTDVVALVKPVDVQLEDAGAIPVRDIVAVSGYLLWRGVTSKAALGAIAALLVLTATLSLLMNFKDNPAQTQETAQTPTRPDASAMHTVATLTAQHEAHWSSGEMDTGQSLHAGQAYILTQGFAEITTRDGAVAILESPCSIELLDNNNALRLHTGKLVGICETESSHGFLVRTPHMDITDLGTRFGVNALQADATEVHVFEGEVEVSAPAAAGGEVAQQRLTTGQAIVHYGLDGFAVVVFDRQRFAGALPASPLQPTVELGSVVWSAQPPPGRIPESESLQVFLEARAITLQEDVVVDFTRRDAWPPEREHGTHHVPAGRTVDVYLLHLDTPGDQSFRGNYTINFGRPILGVIGANGGFGETDLLVSASDELKNYISRGVAPDDRITITGDGHAMNLSLHVAEATDHVRVLVLSE